MPTGSALPGRAGSATVPAVQQGLSTMAKSRLNTALTALRGRVGDLIFKQYDYGTVVTRAPRMKNVKWSPAQIAHRQRVKAAGAFYRAVVSDPTLKKKFEAVAAKKRIPLSAVTLAEYMKQHSPTQTPKPARRRRGV